MTDHALDQLLEYRRQAHDEVVSVDVPQARLVIFSLGKGVFAFDAAEVREILAPRKVYPLPGCAAQIEGVMNLRGTIESVLRIDELLAQKSVLAAEQAMLLLAEAAGVRSGVRVDKVVDVLDVAVDNIEPPSASLPEALMAITRGIVRYRDHTVLWLSAETIFRQQLKAAS